MKTQKKLRDFLLAALPPSLARRISTTLVQRQCSHTILSFPPSCADFKFITIIMPQHAREALLQAAQLQTLLHSFEHSTITLLCTHEVADFIKHFSNNAEIVAYDPDNFRLFSSHHAAVARTLSHTSCDLCILLEQGPTATLQHLCGMSGATYRIGYSEGASYPFTNCHIRPSPSAAYLPQQYGAIVRMLGCAVKKVARCAVSKEIMVEVQMLLKDLGIRTKAQAPLVGIDAVFFYQTYGSHWTSMLLQALTETSGAQLYALHDKAGTIIDWLTEQGVSVLPPLNASRQGAILLSSSCFISANTALFQLAAIFNAPCIGLFERDQEAAFYKPQKKLFTVTYSQAPDTASIDAIVATLNSALQEA